MNHDNTNAPGRVWLITGCSSGLGLALATFALARGQRVIATARQLTALDELKALYPHTCLPIALDVTNALQVQAAFAQGMVAFGRLDVLVNNAGCGLIGAFEEFAKEQITRNFEVNFFAGLDLIRRALPIFRAQRSGHIVNISAAAAISNYAGFSIYGASKWALEGVSEALAAELKPLGINVTIVQPGPFRTDFISRSLESAENHIPDYDNTSGKFRRLLQTMDGKQPGDPDKAACAIFAVVEHEKPPLRLVLGKYATDKVRKKTISIESDLVAWASVGSPTEFTSTL